MIDSLAFLYGCSVFVIHLTIANIIAGILFNIIQTDSIFFDVVKWNNLRCRFDTENHGTIDEDDVLKVIGNIYENPELLEEK